MSRLARVFGPSGYMHIITRGIGRQLLFEEDSDYAYYIKLLKKYSEEAKVTINAYCLMENHVHILIFDELHNVPAMMQKIGVRYSMYFNRKYDRTGHLFQDRYISEVIDSKEYLITVFRYILRNPEKAGICQASEYKWSSYDLYNDPKSFVDTTVFHELFGSEKIYESFVNIDSGDECREYDRAVHDDDWAKRIISMILRGKSGTVLQQYSRNDRNNVIRQLRKRGLTIKQIERLTGINRGVIQRAQP